MSEIFSPAIPCRITFPTDLTYEECKTLLDAESKGVFCLMDDSIKNIAECKTKLFKLGFKFYDKKGFTFIQKDLIFAKFVWKQKFVKLNPLIFEQEIKLTNEIKDCLKAFPDDFLFLSMGSSYDKESLLKQLETME